MMHNLVPYMHHKYGNQVLWYFAEEALEAAREDNWDSSTQRVICSTNRFMEEKVEDNIRLEQAQLFLEEHKKAMEEQKQVVNRPNLQLLEE